MLALDLPMSTVEERTLETASTPGTRARAADAAGEKESKSELVVRT
jgi:hypothetical protein